MIKFAAGPEEAEQILRRIYAENPRHWPHGLSVGHFDDGCYLIREKSSNHAVGVAGFQKRHETSPQGVPQLVGYYSIGILPEYRRRGFAKEAVARLLREKSAGVDVVRALVVATNAPSLALARHLPVTLEIKQAAAIPASAANPFSQVASEHGNMKPWAPPLQLPASEPSWEQRNTLPRNFSKWQQNQELSTPNVPMSYWVAWMLRNVMGKPPGQDYRQQMAGGVR